MDIECVSVKKIEIFLFTVLYNLASYKLTSARSHTANQNNLASLSS